MTEGWEVEIISGLLISNETFSHGGYLTSHVSEARRGAPGCQIEARTRGSPKGWPTVKLFLTSRRGLHLLLLEGRDELCRCLADPLPVRVLKYDALIRKFRKLVLKCFKLKLKFSPRRQLTWTESFRIGFKKEIE
jgi:hypothetical protein